MDDARRTIQRTRHRGFSLIEVLISVLILALGLLGLGAVFPVVIREQRLGQERVQGVLALNSARAILANINFDRELFQVGGTTSLTTSFWNELSRQSQPTGTPPTPGLVATDGRRTENWGGWKVATVAVADSSAQLVTNAINPGGVAVTVGVPIASRVYPQTDARVGQPQFVWDFAVQRVSPLDNVGPAAGVYPPGAIRAAVFVRRIDTQIRITPGSTLMESFLGQTPERVPVAADTDGRPTLDGIGGTGAGTPTYSNLRTQTVHFIVYYGANGKQIRNLLSVRPTDVNGPNPVNWELARRPGQRLVDNLGNIYNVVGSVGVTEPGKFGPYLIVDPPVPDSVTEEQTGTGVGNFDPKEVIRQVIFSPVIPSAVGLVELRP